MLQMSVCRHRIALYNGLYMAAADLYAYAGTTGA